MKVLLGGPCADGSYLFHFQLQFRPVNRQSAGFVIGTDQRQILKVFVFAAGLDNLSGRLLQRLDEGIRDIFRRIGAQAVVDQLRIRVQRELLFVKNLALPLAEVEQQRIPCEKRNPKLGITGKIGALFANVLVACCWTTCITKRS